MSQLYIVTGASRGLGLALVQALVQRALGADAAALDAPADAAHADDARAAPDLANATQGHRPAVSPTHRRKTGGKQVIPHPHNQTHILTISRSLSAELRSLAALGQALRHDKDAAPSTQTSANPGTEASAEPGPQATQARVQLTHWQHDLRTPEPIAERLGQWLADQSDWPQQLQRAVLINNAGMMPSHIAPLSDSRAADLAELLQLNLLAPLVLSAQFLRSTAGWRAARQVLGISSPLGHLPMAAMAPYASSKAGLDQATRCLALEEAAKPGGARVCAIGPAVVDTDMQRHMRDTADDAFPGAKAFRHLHRFGRLSSAQATAQQLLALLDSPTFGDPPVLDLPSAPRAGKA